MLKKYLLIGSVGVLSSMGFAEEQDAEVSADALAASVEVGVEREWLTPDNDLHQKTIQTHLFRAGSSMTLGELPLSVGAYGAVVNYRDDDVRGASESSGSELGINLKALLSEETTGLPVGFYAKVEVPLYSSISLSDFENTADNRKETMTNKTANKMSVGASFAVMEGTNVFGEYARGARTYEVKVKDVAGTTKEDLKYTTASATLGLTHTL